MLATMLQSELQGFDDVTVVDYFDGRNGVPTPDELEPYNVVIVWSNYVFSDPVGMGDALADYVDNGGGVVLNQFCFGTGWGLAGRIMDQYSSFAQGPTQYVQRNLGEFDPSNPIMEGVTAMSDRFQASVPVINNGQVIASYDDGTPLVAVNPDLPVVSFNCYVGDSRQFTGDAVLIAHNALKYVAGGAVVIPQTYNIYKATSVGGPFNLLASVPGVQKTYVDRPVPNGIDYWYRITAVYPGPDESDPSNVANGRGMNHQPPTPFNVTGVVNGRDVTLHWSYDNSVGDLAHFNVWYRQMPGGTDVLAGSPTDSTMVVPIPGGQDGIFAFTISAVDNGTPPLESLHSRDLFLPIGTLPPTSLRATNGAEFAVPLNWMLPGSWLTTDKANPDQPIQYRPDPVQPLDMSQKGTNGPTNPPVLLNRGGPDEFGYTWVDSDEPDGPAYQWRDIIDIGTQIPLNSDDQNLGPYDIGFDFNFYGNVYNTFNACTNGWISFTSADAFYNNQTLPGNAYGYPFNMVAPFWDDLVFNTGNPTCYYYSDGNELVISYIDVPHISVGGPYTFQIVLRSSGAIYFEYQTLNDPTDNCTVGIQNGDGTVGLEMVYNAAYLHDAMAIRIGTGPEGFPPVHYKLYRSLTAGVPIDPQHLITSALPGLQTSYTDMGGLQNGVTYYYKITAVWPDSSESLPSNEAAGTPANHPPEPPSALHGSVTGRDVTLYWHFTNLMGDFQHFNIYKKLIPGGSWILAGSVTDTTGVVNIQAGQDGVWAFAVTAVDNGAPQLESIHSNEPFLAVGNLPPLFLRGLSDQDGYVPLSWSAPGMRPTTTLSYDDGTCVLGWYYYDDNNIIANMFTANSPIELDTLWIHVFTEGDPGWPWPDPAPDPFNIVVFDDDGTGFPGEQVLSQEVMGELGQAWIALAIDGGLILNGPNFWVGFQNISTDGQEGIGQDATTDFPGVKWQRVSDAWSPQDLYPGDQMIRATIVDNGRDILLSEKAPTQELALKTPRPSFDIPGGHSVASTQGNFSVGLSDGGDNPRPFDTEVLVGYNIYRSTSPNVQPIVGNRIRGYQNQPGTSYRDSAITNGTTYYYVVTAVYDNGGTFDESPVSNEIAATPRLGARMVVNPLSFNVTGQIGRTTTAPLNIANTGGLDLNYNVVATTTLRLDNRRHGNTHFTDSEHPTRVNNGDKSNTPRNPNNPPVLMGRGGPDEFGYSWIDSDEPGGPAYNWIDITDRGAQLYMGDDDSQGPFDIGFNFPFYGQTFSTFRVCSNGFISFTSTMTPWSNLPIPGVDNPSDLVAPFWTDLAPNNGGEVWYYSDGSQLVVSYINVAHFDWDTGVGPYTLQVILTSSGAIFFNYADINPPDNDETIGIQNGDGSIGLQIAYNQTYVHAGLTARITSGWLSADPASGTVTPGNNVNTTIIFDATTLEEGTYTGSLTVTGFDANHQVGEVSIPVTFHVTPQGIQEQGNDLPTEFALSQNYPNPFNPTTEIDFALPSAAHVSLDIFNVLGQKVRTLINSDMQAGYKTVVWDGADDNGSSVSSGTFFYVLKTGDKVFTKKMTMLK